MSLLRAYLQNPRTLRALSRKPGQKGFSLIELVVVIAVLAVLTAIALPNFLGVTEDASARTAQQAALNAFKECKVFWARNKREGSGDANVREFNVPQVTDWQITAHTAGITWGNAIKTTTQPESGDDGVACFEATTEANRDFFAVPKDTDKFPTYKISAAGERLCIAGKVLAGNEETFNIGCSADKVWPEQGVWE